MFAYERQQGTLRRLLTTPPAKRTYLLGTISGQVADGAGADVLAGRLWHPGDETELGARAAGAVRHAARSRAGRGGVRHHDGDLRQDRRSGQRIEHHVRHGHGIDGWMLVSAGVVPLRDPERRKDPSHHRRCKDCWTLVLRGSGFGGYPA
ncbi:MAG: hypothetical protein MZV64_59395 [Ignavibacteriales bacterium]|nr:hypothetical protein [Ignavibacteriales bacterium]